MGMDTSEPGPMFFPVNPLLMSGEVEIFIEDERIRVERERIESVALADLETAIIMDRPR